VDTAKAIDTFHKILMRFYSKYVVPHVFNDLTKE
jgi:hypothetical protein